MNSRPIGVDELKVMISFASRTSAIISDLFCKEVNFLTRTLFGSRASFTNINLFFLQTITSTRSLGIFQLIYSHILHICEFQIKIRLRHKDPGVAKLKFTGQTSFKTEGAFACEVQFVQKSDLIQCVQNQNLRHVPLNIPYIEIYTFS